MTSPEAQALHDRITAAGGWVMWFVISSTAGRFIGRGMVVDHRNGHQEGDDLVAYALDELRAMLPVGLTRRDRTVMMTADVVETWD